MDVLITDVTEMHAGNFCVAGWCAAECRMVRPLPAGRNWTAGLLAEHNVEPGTTIRVRPGGAYASSFPHRTEDTPVPAIEFVSAGFSQWLGPNGPAANASLSLGFANLLHWNSIWNGTKQGTYVPAGSQCRSLVAVNLARNALTLAEDFGKLRATIADGQDRYKLAVTSCVLKGAWRANGVAAACARLPNRDRFHLRIGLARAFANAPDKCYLMVNGVL